MGYMSFGKTKVAKDKLYVAKMLMIIQDVNGDIIVIQKQVETKNNSKYLIGYLEEVTRLVVLMLPEMSGYVKIFKDKDGDNNKNNILMSLLINDDKL